MQVTRREIQTGCKEKNCSDGGKNMEREPKEGPHPQRYWKLGCASLMDLENLIDLEVIFSEKCKSSKELSVSYCTQNWFWSFEANPKLISIATASCFPNCNALLTAKENFVFSWGKTDTSVLGSLNFWWRLLLELMQSQRQICFIVQLQRKGHRYWHKGFPVTCQRHFHLPAEDSKWQCMRINTYFRTVHFLLPVFWPNVAFKRPEMESLGIKMWETRDYTEVFRNLNSAAGTWMFVNDTNVFVYSLCLHILWTVIHDRHSRVLESNFLLNSLFNTYIKSLLLITDKSQESP